MRVSKCLGLLAAVLLIGGAALAQTPYVYVSNPDEDMIYAVDPEGGLDQDLVEVYYEEGSNYQDLVVGPDGLLYACDPSNQRITRINISDDFGAFEVVYEGGGSGYAFQCGWFKNNGDFFVSDTAGGGVFSCAGLAVMDFGFAYCTSGEGGNLAPVDNLVFEGQGLTQAAIGDLLAVDQGAGKLWELEIDPYSGLFSPLGGAELISGLDSPIGVARSADGAIFVATADRLIQYSADGSEIGVCDEGFGRRDDPYFLDFAANDTLYVATISNKAGILWEMATDGCDCDGSNSACEATKKFVFDRKSGYEPAAVGVAVPLTTDTVDKFGFYGEQLFSFQDHGYELTAGVDAGNACTASIEAVEVTPECLERLIDTIPITEGDPNDPDNEVVATPVLYNGDGGYGQVYFVTGQATCPRAEDDLYRHAISAYTEFLANPRMVRCDDMAVEDLCDPDFYLPEGTCTVAKLNSYFPFNGVFEGDGRIKSTSPTFSEYFLVEVALATGTTPGIFCGFETPFINPPVPPGDEACNGHPCNGYNDPDILYNSDFVAALPVFSTTETAPFKFKIAATEECNPNDPDDCWEIPANCNSGPYVTSATVLMSIARLREGTPLEEVFVPTPVYAAGNSAIVDPAIFNEAENPTKTYHFNGKFPDPPYEPGVYQIVLVPLTDNFGAEVRYFKVAE